MGPLIPTIGSHGVGPVRRGLVMRRVITQCLDELNPGR
jgi:hypothetical protein